MRTLEKQLSSAVIEYPAEIEKALVKGIRSNAIVPVICGSALQNIGVSQLMDLIVQGLPSPLERGSVKGVKPGTEEPVEISTSVDVPFSGLVFKTVADPFAGKLSVLRVFKGRFHAVQCQQGCK